MLAKIFAVLVGTVSLVSTNALATKRHVLCQESLSPSEKREYLRVMEEDALFYWDSPQGNFSIFRGERNELAVQSTPMEAFFFLLGMRPEAILLGSYQQSSYFWWPKDERSLLLIEGYRRDQRLAYFEVSRSNNLKLRWEKTGIEQHYITYSKYARSELPNTYFYLKPQARIGSVYLFDDRLLIILKNERQFDRFDQENESKIAQSYLDNPDSPSYRLANNYGDRVVTEDVKLLSDKRLFIVFSLKSLNDFIGVQRFASVISDEQNASHFFLSLKERDVTDHPHILRLPRNVREVSITPDEKLRLSRILEDGSTLFDYYDLTKQGFKFTDVRARGLSLDP